LKKAFYENVRENTIALERAQNKQRTRLIFARTIVFPLMLAALIHGYDADVPAELMLGGVLLLLFGVLVMRHQKLDRMRLFTQAYLAVTTGYLERFSGEWKSLPENGAAYAKEKRPPDRDLHIFGAASLYQYLCAARTRAGRDRLAAALFWGGEAWLGAPRAPRSEGRRWRRFRPSTEGRPQRRLHPR